MRRRDFDRGIKIRDRFFPIFVAQVNRAAIVKGQRIIEARFHLNYFGKVRLRGFAIIQFFHEHQTAREIGFGFVRIFFDEFAIVLRQV